MSIFKTALGIFQSSLFPGPLALLTAGSGNYTVSSAAAAACTLTFATLPAGESWGALKIEVGYDVLASADGLLAIKNLAGVTLWAMPITSPGPAPFDLDDFLLGVTVGFTVSLKGATGAKGYINARPKKDK